MMELAPVVGQRETVSFHSDADWTASCPADWLTIVPAKGVAGDGTVTLTTASTNRTKTTRTALLTITAGGDRRTVSLIQSNKYAIFDKKEYSVSAQGGTVQLNFKTNIDKSENMQVRYYKYDWINWTNGSRKLTRAEESGMLNSLTVAPNTTGKSRVASFILSLPSDNEGWMGLDTAYVTQPAATSDYTSTDFSADGNVTVLQQATKGRGINFVLMGDGFADVDIADGTYDHIMYQSMEHLFSEEPVRSLRDYFTVYAVTAVSKNRGVGSNQTTALSTLPSGMSSMIDYDLEQVQAYVDCVDGIDKERSLSVVIVNSNSYNGVTALMSDEKTGRLLQYSVALCTLSDGVDSERFRQVLVHEAIGHGLAKLADEYGYDSNGGPSAEEVRRLEAYHKNNWMINVDTETDVDKVLWSPFVSDSRYASEAVGLYEGAFTYVYGVYRPTSESMMRSNQSPFNAPSRKAIFDRVMLLGEGRESSAYEEFSAFDQEHLPAEWNYATRSLPVWQCRRLSPPMFIRLRQ